MATTKAARVHEGSGLLESIDRLAREVEAHERGLGRLVVKMIESNRTREAIEGV